MNHFQRTLFTTVIVVSPLMQTQAPQAQAAQPLLVHAGSEAAVRVAVLLQRVGERLLAGAPDGSDEGRRTWLAQAASTAIDTLRAAVGPRTCH